MEDYAYILDYLPHGRSDKRGFRREPMAYALGDTEFKLFELTPKDNVALSIGERVYIGKDVKLRDAILHVKRRVRYEDLTTAPRERFARILDFLGLTSDPDLLDHAGTVIEPQIGRWREKMDPADERRIESLLGDSLRSLGYPLTGAGESSSVPSPDAVTDRPVP